MPRLRMRTTIRERRPDRPSIPPTDPKRIPHPASQEHSCAECFEKRSRYAGCPFCYQCERELFGVHGYQGFIRHERMIRINAEAAVPAKGFHVSTRRKGDNFIRTWSTPSGRAYIWYGPGMMLYRIDGNCYIPVAHKKRFDTRKECTEEVFRQEERMNGAEL